MVLEPSVICVHSTCPLLALGFKLGILGLPPFITVLNIPSLSVALFASAFSLTVSV